MAPAIKDANDIRSTVINHWLKQYNIRQVQYMIGHKYVSSTERYSTNKLETLQEQIELLHPREQNVMLDRDLAEFYGVETKYLKRQVKRNIARFPDDFMFELSQQELNEWR